LTNTIELIKNGESQTIEFKGSPNTGGIMLSKNIIIDKTRFMNSKTIIIGDYKK